MDKAKQKGQIAPGTKLVQLKTNYGLKERARELAAMTKLRATIDKRIK